MVRSRGPSCMLGRQILAYSHNVEKPFYSKNWFKMEDSAFKDNHKVLFACKELFNSLQNKILKFSLLLEVRMGRFFSARPGPVRLKRPRPGPLGPLAQLRYILIGI